MRTGSEALQARSPLKMRRGLALWGMVWAAAGTVAFSVAGRPGWAAACAVVAVLAAIDLTIVVRHIHQGAHYQPGKDVPPYEPVHDPRRGAPRHRSADLGWGGGGPMVGSRATEGRMAVAGAVSAGGRGEGQLGQVEEGVRGRKVT
ncbi:DUF6343 family protein [Streptomyces rimosus]|uniref:DUF6343 family protein n=1 Tax=Streptomyces rimosus TaxID=1927 RepID=UPI0030CA1B26